MIKNDVLLNIVTLTTTAASNSPCQSKRGAAIFDGEGIVLAAGFNDQPRPFVCDGSHACKANCGRTAIHAEQAAILNCAEISPDTSMIHVKAMYGVPCHSGPPSCLECSKIILASGVQWMHLLSSPNAQMLPGSEVVGTVRGFLDDLRLGDLQIRRYSAEQFHWLTAEYSKRITLLVGDAKSQPSACERKELEIP